MVRRRRAWRGRIGTFWPKRKPRVQCNMALPEKAVPGIGRLRAISGHLRPKAGKAGSSEAAAWAFLSIANGRGASLAVAVLTAAWWLDPADLVDKARERAFETISGALPRDRDREIRVAVIDIDRESLARIGPWPWRRSQIADADRQGCRHGAQGDRRRHPARRDRTGGDLPRSPGSLPRRARAREIDTSAFADDDRRLRSAIARRGNVVLGVVLDDAGSGPSAARRRRSPSRAIRRVSSPRRGERPARALRGVRRRGGRRRRAVVPGRHPRAGGERARCLRLAESDVFPGFALEAIRVAEQRSHLHPEGRSVSHRGRIADGSRRCERRRCGCIFRPPDTWPRRTISAWTLLADGGEPRRAARRTRSC